MHDLNTDISQVNYNIYIISNLKFSIPNALISRWIRTEHSLEGLEGQLCYLENLSLLRIIGTMIRKNIYPWVYRRIKARPHTPIECMILHALQNWTSRLLIAETLLFALGINNYCIQMSRDPWSLDLEVPIHVAMSYDAARPGRHKVNNDFSASWGDLEIQTQPFYGFKRWKVLDSGAAGQGV